MTLAVGSANIVTPGFNPALLIKKGPAVYPQCPILTVDQHFLVSYNNYSGFHHRVDEAMVAVRARIGKCKGEFLIG